MRFSALILALPLFASAQSHPEPQAEKAHAVTPAPHIEKLSEAEFRLGAIRFNPTTRTVSFPARVNMRNDHIEYAVVHEDGKTHESLLRTAVRPFDLQTVLLLCGFKPSPGDLFARFRRDATGAPGDRPRDPAPPPNSAAAVPPAGMHIHLEWMADGIKARARLEDWIVTLRTGTPLKDRTWSFTGSSISDGAFQAEVDGSMIALYLDPSAMINISAPGNDNDENWIPASGTMPSLDTPVQIIIAPANPPAQRPKAEE